MKVLLKIAILLAGIWAGLHPSVYGFIFIVASDSSAVVDFLVLGSCVVVVWDAFNTVPRFAWSASLSILFMATAIGFFHLFRDFGESGPLPYEWLNGYYKFSLPLIGLTILKYLLSDGLGTFRRQQK